MITDTAPVAPAGWKIKSVDRDFVYDMTTKEHTPMVKVFFEVDDYDSRDAFASMLNAAPENAKYREALEMAVIALNHCNMNGWMLADFEDQMYATLKKIDEVLNK